MKWSDDIDGKLLLQCQNFQELRCRHIKTINNYIICNKKVTQRSFKREFNEWKAWRTRNLCGSKRLTLAKIVHIIVGLRRCWKLDVLYTRYVKYLTGIISPLYIAPQFVYYTDETMRLLQTRLKIIYSFIQQFCIYFLLAIIFYTHIYRNFYLFFLKNKRFAVLRPECEIFNFKTLRSRDEEMGLNYFVTIIEYFYCIADELIMLYGQSFSYHSNSGTHACVVPD